MVALPGSTVSLASQEAQAIKSGVMCGFSVSVKDKKYFYFCGAATGNMSCVNAMCASSCMEGACPKFKGISPIVHSRPFAGLLAVCIPPSNKRCIASRLQPSASQRRCLGLDNTVLSFKYTPLITSAGFAFAICGRSYLGRVSPPLPR